MCEKYFREKKGNHKTHVQKKYQHFRHLVHNPTVPKNVMGFSNHAERFTGPNYLEVNSVDNSASKL